MKREAELAIIISCPSSYLEKVNIADLVKNKDTCDEKVQLMEEAIISGMDAIMPLKEKSISVNEAPWMNNSLKRLIRRRQKALANNNLAEYKQLRNKVNRDRKACRAKYYDAKVKDLKACKPAQW